ncbi:hypothetical protein CYK37_14215 [Mesorhizobium loti]|nr:hypothetical protein CYK37_14215 [Mesorhizobium loti]
MAEGPAPAGPFVLAAPGHAQFQEKCVTVFRPELRKNKKLERFRVSVKNGNALMSTSGKKPRAAVFPLAESIRPR